MCHTIIKWFLILCVLSDSLMALDDAHFEEASSTNLNIACASELEEFCKNVRNTNDIAILQCLYSSDMQTLSTRIQERCLKAILSSISIVTNNRNVKSALSSRCQSDLSKFSCQTKGIPGSYLKCVVGYADNITSADCANLIDLYKNIAYQDHKWIALFLEDCQGDSERLHCGQLHSDRATQSLAISCLQDKLDHVTRECRNQVLRLSELIPSNFKFDRQLFIACHVEYARYCKDLPVNSGQVFDCLSEHVTDHKNGSCYEQLIRRQKLISQDYKVSKGLMRSCKDDIKKYHCRKQTSDDKNIRLAQILLCIENAIRNKEVVNNECRSELIEHRKMLMQDYRLIPEIVDGCSIEIKKFCSNLDFGSQTIHCLMEHVRSKHKFDRIRDSCQRSLEILIKEVDIGEDWRVDPVLYEACHPVVRNLCRGIKGGNARVMSCLMDNIGADEMLEKCENALMQIQYFVARDFKLDPQLYISCHDDAVQLCHATDNWLESSAMYKPDNSPLILPCLFRYINAEDSFQKLRNTCVEQIRRVMQQRAASVDLQPEIERVCLDDLALLCFDKTAKGEEIQCLQKNLDDLQKKCQDVVSTFTEEEAQFVDLNPFIRKYCKRAMNTHCSDETKDMMDCLIAFKNYPDIKANNKCRASIEHFQIISLKDYHFTYKFKTACKNYVMRYCRTLKSKASVVACLSEKIRNDTINGLKSDIHKDCKQQIKAQLFQQRENFDFDPILNKTCFNDLRTHCPMVDHGTAQALECLQSTSAKISIGCRKELFKIKTEEMTDNSVDYALITTCSESARQYCSQVEKSRILDCLKKFKDEPDFDQKCRTIVMHRLLEQQSDFRLNPLLRMNCKKDMEKFCKNVVVHSDLDTNGQMIKCLTGPFKRSKLSDSCEVQMAAILKDRVQNLPLNPTLVEKCKRELETVCKVTDVSSDFGKAEDCLKEALVERKIFSYECQVEVADLIDEAQADIHVDPRLERSCALDLLKYCGNVQQGHGRYIKCLKIVMSDSSKQLERECELMLSKRLEMYSSAAKIVLPDDLRGLYSQVVTSPAKHYFLMVILMTLGSFFVIGIFCGRMSRRYFISKNK